MGDSRIAGIGNSMMAQTSGIDVVKRQEEAAEVMFADMISLNGTADTDNFTADVADEMLGTVESHEIDARNEKPADAYEKYQYKDKTIRTETSDSKPEKVEEAVAEVKEYEEAVTEVIAEELHVSKEEIEAAMEELGLTCLDLLDKANLANLVVKLTGSENIQQLLCNEAFTNVLQQVNELGKALLQEVQLTPEELKAVMQLVQESVDSEDKFMAAKNSELETTETTTENVAIEDVAIEDVATENTVTENAVIQNADEVNATQNVKTETIIKSEEVLATEDEQKTENGVKIEVLRVDTTEEKQMDTQEENLNQQEQDFAGTANKNIPKAQSTSVNESVVAGNVQNTTFTEQLGTFETSQPLPPQVSVSDIMEQFVEQARVSIAVDTTKMEMQLNPEHLGKLYVEVLENEGSITAKIQTQNTVVKEALEMQIADLKVNLNQAGVKVDSVEVTVASHEFERNLEQDTNSQKQQEDAQAKTTRHRNINLNGLDELSGLMTEEETLVAKMMAEQGNSVDFTA